MGTLDGNRAAALAWVNDMRQRWNMPSIEKLEPGWTNGVENCTLAQSLNGRACFFNDGRYMPVLGDVDDIDDALELPAEVAVFEHDFERGHYPDLIAPGARVIAYWREDCSPRPRPTADDAPVPYAPVGDPEFMPR